MTVIVCEEIKQYEYICPNCWTEFLLLKVVKKAYCPDCGRLHTVRKDTQWQD